MATLRQDLTGSNDDSRRRRDGADSPIRAACAHRCPSRDEAARTIASGDALAINRRNCRRVPESDVVAGKRLEGGVTSTLGLLPAVASRPCRLIKMHRRCLLVRRHLRTEHGILHDGDFRRPIRSPTHAARVRFTLPPNRLGCDAIAHRSGSSVTAVETNRPSMGLAKNIRPELGIRTRNSRNVGRTHQQIERFATERNERKRTRRRDVRLESIRKHAATSDMRFSALGGQHEAMTCGQIRGDDRCERSQSWGTSRINAWCASELTEANDSVVRLKIGTRHLRGLLCETFSQRSRALPVLDRAFVHNRNTQTSWPKGPRLPERVETEHANSDLIENTVTIAKKRYHGDTQGNVGAKTFAAILGSNPTTPNDAASRTRTDRAWGNDRWSNQGNQNWRADRESSNLGHHESRSNARIGGVAVVPRQDLLPNNGSKNRVPDRYRGHQPHSALPRKMRDSSTGRADNVPGARTFNVIELQFKTLEQYLVAHGMTP